MALLINRADEHTREVHITIMGRPEFVEPQVRNLGGGTWAFSCIDGDPVLGKGVKCYATTHWRGMGLDEIDEKMFEAAAQLTFGCKVIRCKIELIERDYRL